MPRCAWKQTFSFHAECFLQLSELALLCEPCPYIADWFFFSLFSVLVVLVMVFAVCWAPFHIDRLFFSFVVEWTEPLANIFNLIHVVSGKALFFLLHGDGKNVFVSVLFGGVIYFLVT